MKQRFSYSEDPQNICIDSILHNHTVNSVDNNGAINKVLI